MFQSVRAIYESAQSGKAVELPEFIKKETAFAALGHSPAGAWQTAHGES